MRKGVRCDDGENLNNSSKYRIWGISSKTFTNKQFAKTVKSGDRLWFVKNNSQGKLIAVATYCSHNLHEFGPKISLTNEKLSGVYWASNLEVHYTDLYRLNDFELFTHIKDSTTNKKNNEKCRINLPVEYSYIVRYSKVTCQL